MTNAFSFDPDRFVTAGSAPVEPLHKMPDAWAHGLLLLAERALPIGATRERWAQIVADCRRIATAYQQEVVGAGWSIENLFGFDLSQADGFYGLAVALRGQNLIRIQPDEAVIAKLEGGWRIHRPRMPPGSPLLWTFNKRAPDPC